MSEPNHTHSDDEAPIPAKSAEDRKAAAAMSSLDKAANDDDASKAGASKIDQVAILRAIQRLTPETGAAKVTDGVGGKKEVKEVKKVKVDAADVALLVKELELSKLKATELLKAHDGDAIKAMRAFVTPAQCAEL